MANIFTKYLDYLNASLDTRIEGLQKSESVVEDLSKGEKADGSVGRKGLLFDPFLDQNYASGLFKPKATLLSNTILKHVSRKDPIVSSIIDVRASQVSSFCKRPANRLDYGFKLVPKDKNSKENQDDAEIRKLEEFILNCGYTEDRTHEDKMTFDQWGYTVASDFMRYGHASIEMVNRRDGDLFSFLPLPAETIYYANKKVDQKIVANYKDIWQNTTMDKDKLDLDRAAKGEYEFIQVIDGKVTEGFTRDELIFARLNLESDVDLNGYAIGPTERAISAILSHLNIENHQRSFFTHGTASKGLLVLQGDVTPNTLRALQTQWNNQITGPVNAWRTPILAGSGLQANWIPLTQSNRDMEFAAYQDHILRTICTAMAINPTEIGFDYLSKGTEQRSLGESSNEWKIEASRDRGLRPMLHRIEAIINEEVLPKYSKQISEKYHFQFVGLDAETAEEELARLQAETGLHTTLNEARKQVEKDNLQYGGNLILNPIYLQYLQANMTKGEFMEKIMGVQGASQRPDLQYIPDPLWFQWQQMQMQMMGVGGGGQDPQGGGDGGGGNPFAEGGDQGEGGEMSAEEQQQQQAEQEALAQQQQEAIQQYMAANPELFKSLKANMDKHEDLKKSEYRHKRATHKHVNDMTTDLVKDIRRANEALIKEIMAAVQEDLADKGKK